MGSLAAEFFSRVTSSAWTSGRFCRGFTEIALSLWVWAIVVTRESLKRGIAQVKAGGRIGDISHAVQTYAESQGFGVVRQYVGHGIGRALHEEPQVPNYGEAGRGPLLKKGMTIAIEPMLNVGGWETEQLKDGWTVVTADRSLSAHFEDTVAITPKGAEVLTTPEGYFF